MNQETLKALRESVEHWERLASGKRRLGEVLGSNQCSLCRMFLLSVDNCSKCPVFENTRFIGCLRTPYHAAAAEVKRYGFDTEQFKTAAKVELAFLKSLLPKEVE